jgi:hypothetical protein
VTVPHLLLAQAEAIRATYPDASITEEKWEKEG